MPVIEYRIHPSVGIARMGDSPTVYFAGAERPSDKFSPTLRKIPGAGGPAAPAAGLRDAAGKLAKQAARFRIFAYSYDDYIFWRDDHPSEVWEVTGSADYEITWTVQVANLKSYAGDPSRRWRDGRPGGSGITEKPNDPAAQRFASTVAGSYTAVKKFQKAGRLQLGSAVLDDQGNARGDRATLLVFGSDGAARLIPGASTEETGLFKPGWEDDAADGPVRATVTPKASSTRPDRGMGTKSARDAWVVINLPDYGMDIEEPGSLYETALNLGTYHANRDRSCCFKKDFFGDEVTLEKHVMPILKSYLQLRFVSKDVQDGNFHEDDTLGTIRDPADRSAHRIFPRMRMPEPTSKKPGFITNTAVEDVQPMYGPDVAGNDDKTMPQQKYFSIPRLLHDWMAKWKAGTLPRGGTFPPIPVRAKDRPELMDMAALQTMNGGSFLPGLEVGRHIGLWQNWMADYGAKGGSVDIRIVKTNPPGTFTRHLATPWQADFLMCKDGWWPASRPEETSRVSPLEFKVWMADPTGAEITDFTDLITHWATLGFVRKEGGALYLLDDEFLDHRPLPALP